MVNITKKEFRQLSAFIREHYGINLKEEKEALVTGRLNNVLMQNQFRSFSEYYEYLLADRTGDGITTLINKISTNHTFFMREPDHFFYLRDQILPYLKKTIDDRDMRIWSAGCSTGEEPYTLAMFVDEFLGEEKKAWDAKILATDISNDALDAAKQGIYKNDRIKELPPGWRFGYFDRMEPEASIICQHIKNEVIFRKFNLMEKHFPFRKKFHVIFCRNVMIYFDNPTKAELASRFYEVLEPGGYLFIGHSESLGRENSNFKYLSPAIYRKV